MNIEEIRELYDFHERKNAAYPGYRRELGDNTVRMVNTNIETDAGADTPHDFLIYSQLDTSNADAAIDAELTWFAERGRKFEWKLYSHDRPADLKTRLEARGFSIGEDEAIMALELDSRSHLLAEPSNHDVRRVGYGASLEDYSQVNALTWPGDISWIEITTRILRDEPERMSAWVAYVDGKPVCAARIDFPAASPFASLWGGATLEPYRKRGIYTAVLAARAREALKRGYRFLTIDASPMSRPIAARHGFRLLSISNPCDSPRQ